MWPPSPRGLTPLRDTGRGVVPRDLCSLDLLVGVNAVKSGQTGVLLRGSLGQQVAVVAVAAAEVEEDG